ncbi:hypothetical protein M011DRAFT_484996 [Sporormia fimetaria CBS 119925]|uniref:DNA replication checkpoint mediator MRC1 domain-containing protein n=1 Tax=Sporormia fimetaria CBS 119925 TaxID=1340428 RepID=A0A6A6VIF3_9PLEO|nr:hypothetical protein M011DRAFT_484996 [Sporormia fimetaria CBS 119925]
MDPLSKLIESDDNSDIDEAPVKSPQSKLLTRLRPQLDSSDSGDDDEDADDAYERVKRSLMRDASTPAPNAEAPSARAQVDSTDDEEDMPVRASTTRRRIPQDVMQSSPPVSPVRPQSQSPGLFVTPDASPAANRTIRPSPAGPRHNKDLNERIARIRADRLAKEESRKTQQAKRSRQRVHDGSSSDSMSDGENGRRLTQQARPTRKAGKKALEEMAREQQRIKRGMQLAHQSKTKKKYTLKDLLPRMGLAQVGSELVPVGIQVPTPDASSELALSDAEARQAEELHAPGEDVEVPPVMGHEARDDSNILASPPRLNKGKGRAPEFQHLPQNVVEPRQSEFRAPAPSKPQQATEMVELWDSDEEIEKPRSRFPVFDRLPQMDRPEAVPLLHLRHLAQVNSPKRKSKGHKMNMADLHLSIAQKARQQARKEREEKIEELRRRGIHIETEEEREKQQLEIEDMVAQLEKAREKELRLAKREREEAKKNGEQVSSDESEDEDYVGSDAEGSDVGEPVVDDEEMQLSGSEEELEDTDNEEEEEEQDTNGLIDAAAEENDEEEDVQVDTALEQTEADGEDEEDIAPARRAANRSRNVVLEEDDSESETQPKAATQISGAPSQTQEDDVMAAFGFNNPASGGLGLTQMFASTMANIASESANVPLDSEPEQDSMDIFRSLLDTQTNDPTGKTAALLVPNSQGDSTQTQRDEPQFSLGIAQILPSTPQMSQHSDVFDPTQDTGPELTRLPAGLVEPHSTIETVLLGGQSPVAMKKSRLHRRKPADLSDVDEDMASAATEQVPQTADDANAFSKMKKAAKKQQKAAQNFNKKTSWARDAIEEQAEESEDEYAGLGGASDEDSGEEDEQLAQMIDTSEVKVDEAKLAAYYAEKDKADDERNINQLYKDLMHGGLRKRRGGDAFDVSDDEDEREQRLRKKRAEFQRMTNALLADERVGEIAKNPKRMAFFRTMVDSLDDPEYDFLDAPMAEEANDDSSPSQPLEEGRAETTIPESQIDEVHNTHINPLKRKSPDSQKENRPPPHLRRTAADSMSRKPMTIADIKHSVSELLDDHIVIPDSQFSDHADSDSDLEIETSNTALEKPIIDRLRTAHTSVSRQGHMAFVTNTNAPRPGFRMTALRRATGSSVSITTSGSMTPVEGGVRRGGTGRSNIHAQAREAERQAALEKVTKKRRETLAKKVAMKRGQRSVLRDLDEGFE